ALHPASARRLARRRHPAAPRGRCGHSGSGIGGLGPAPGRRLPPHGAARRAAACPFGAAGGVMTSPRPPRAFPGGPVLPGGPAFAETLRHGGPARGPAAAPASLAVAELTLHEFEARYRELLG